MSLLSVPTKLFFRLFMAHHQPALLLWVSVDCSPLSVSTQQKLSSLLSWVESKPEPVESKRHTPSSWDSTPADLHFHVFLPQLVKVSCIFCVEVFTGLSYRPPETRDGVLYPSSPSLNIRSVSVHAKLKQISWIFCCLLLKQSIHSSRYSHHTSTNATCHSWTVMHAMGESLGYASPN